MVIVISAGVDCEGMFPTLPQIYTLCEIVSDGSWQAEEKEKERKVMSQRRGERQIGAGKDV